VAKVLAENEVHTVISALRVLDAPTSEAEVNLVRATVQAGTPKRFVASVLGVDYPETYVPLIIFQIDGGILTQTRFSVAQARQRTIDELRKTKLNWTRFFTGFFLDYYGPPSLKSYMQRVTWAVDIPNKKAGIPGTGNEPMAFTYTFDAAKFVVAALGLPEWDEDMYFYGEKTTWNGFLKLAEDIIGTIVPCSTFQRLSVLFPLFYETDERLPHRVGSTFEVAYDPPEKLQKGEITELPSHDPPPDQFPKEVMKGLMAVWGGLVLDGKFDIPTDKALNKVFPDIQPLKVKDVLEM
jgi:hypothetical protein